MIRATIATALGLTAMSVFAAEKFPAHPLSGSFALASSTPAIDTIDARQLQAEIFQPGQRVQFEFKGETGADRPGREDYKVTLLPPFDRSFCLRPQWSLSCPGIDGTRPPDASDRPPAAPLVYEANLDAQRLKTQADVDLYKHFVPYGLKPGGFVYVLTYTDSRASYVLYLKDADTLISRAAYNTSADDVVAVDQVLKRVK